MVTSHYSQYVYNRLYLFFEYVISNNSLSFEDRSTFIINKKLEFVLTVSISNESI